MSTATVTKVTRWPASYERISRFKVDRDGVSAEISRGVVRQAEDNTAVCEAMALGTPQSYRDEDRSASQFATKLRDDWVRLLADLEAGRVSHVFVWLFDRAFRTTEAAEALLAACRKGNALIVQTAGNPTTADPHNPDDIFRLKLAGLLAEYEIAKMSMRQRRAKQANAKLGKTNGGRRCFGYTPGYTMVVPTEAAAVQTVVTKVLGGASLRSQALWLNSQGLTGTSGAKWTGGNLGHFLRRPALAGLRQFTDAETGTKVTVDAAWRGHAILTAGQYEQLKGLLTAEGRQQAGASTNVRKRRFTGLMRCGMDGCTQTLRSAPYRSRAKADRGAYRVNYRCVDGHVSRPMELVEETVMAVAAEYLTRLRPDGMLQSPEQEAELGRLVARATQLRDRIDRKRADYRADLIDGTLLKEAVDEAEGELRQVEALKAELLQAHTVLADLAGKANARELLDAMPVDRLRTVIDHLAVVYLDQSPHLRGPHAAFTPELVRFDWKVGT